MSYPGDQQQPGGWGPSPSPPSPYGPVEDQAGHAPHGDGPHDDPYGDPPRAAGHGPGGSYGERQRESFGGGPSFGPSWESPDPYGGGPGGHGPGGEGEDRPGSGRKRLGVIAAVVAAVAVVGVIAAVALTSGGGGKAPAAAPTTPPPPTPTVNPTPSPTETGRGDRLTSRASDPKPLTLNEVFKVRSFKAGGKRYVMTARRSERKCAPPTHGALFRKALAKAGCTQVLRATFSNGSKLIGTIGVLNLRTQTAAETVQAASRQKDAFILALPGAGTTKKIGQGLSLTTAEVDGHYLIMSWVQYPNGKKIASSDYSGVTSFVRATTYGSNLRTALNYRSMEGKPS